MTTTAAIYARASHDPKGERASVDRQRSDALAELERRGWQPADQYVDNNLSAYNGDERPEYLRLVADIGAGTVKAVVAWAGDRLHRNLDEFLAFERLVRKHDVEVAFVKGGDWTVESADGRLSGRLISVIAQHESEKKSERISRGAFEAAKQGKPAGGNRPFGYEPDKITVRESEAAKIRAAARLVLAGGSLRSIGRQWGMHPKNVKRILTSARIAGYREHHGVKYPAQWPAIIDDDDHEALCALLGSRTGPAPARSYLLTGIATCGACGAKVQAGFKNGKRNYVHNHPTRDGISRHADPIEAFVVGAVLEALDSEKTSEALRAHESDDASRSGETIRGYEARLAALEHEYENGALDLATWKRMRASLLAKIDDARKALRRQTSRRVLLDLPRGAAQIRAWWDAADLDQRQALLRAVIDGVTIKPVTKGRRFFDPGVELEIIWRH